MALPSSGALKLSDVNVELGLGSTSQRGLGQASTRTLYGVASGAIRLAADGYGKSNRVSLSYTYSASTSYPALNVTSIGGYVSGKSDITVTVNSGVYLSGGFNLTGGNSGDTVTLINNGYIMGDGGAGGAWIYNIASSAVAGSYALSLGFNTTVNNTNGSAYIGGGGGGGSQIFGPGAGTSTGGGGAGGGAGGNLFVLCSCQGNPSYTGGAGGSIGNSGGVGQNATGGGGGRIFPGTGGTGGYAPTYRGNGGGAGGGGGGGNNSSQKGGDGGTATAAGGTGGATYGSGGGGGWGASGGSSGGGGSGGAGGKAVALNGYTITWTSGNTTRVYGSVA